jgi:hypothetical protein
MHEARARRAQAGHRAPCLADLPGRRSSAALRSSMLHTVAPNAAWLSDPESVLLPDRRGFSLPVLTLDAGAAGVRTRLALWPRRHRALGPGVPLRRAFCLRDQRPTSLCGARVPTPHFSECRHGGPGNSSVNRKTTGTCLRQQAIASLRRGASLGCRRQVRGGARRPSRRRQPAGTERSPVRMAYGHRHRPGPPPPEHTGRANGSCRGVAPGSSPRMQTNGLRSSDRV